MELHVDDPRALMLARELAARRNVSVSEAVVAALQAELGRAPRRRIASEVERLSTRLKAIADDLKALAMPGGRDLTKDEIARMWGHE